ncbi:heavy metal-binding domain-containing protein [Sphingobacterium sp. Ag1]|uniref:YbjQ family protein n=1 Tax=Sphingobacterium sp. Ag1 TaxID=1643451 RepID=UPI000A07D776
MFVSLFIQPTTTNSIEGREISRYNDPIAANVVIGTNIFSDIGASYVDFFSGRSTSYEKKIQEMYKGVTETLKQRAQAIRADANIGFSRGFINWRKNLLEKPTCSTLLCRIN